MISWLIALVTRWRNRAGIRKLRRQIDREKAWLDMQVSDDWLDQQTVQDRLSAKRKDSGWDPY